MEKNTNEIINGHGRIQGIVNVEAKPWGDAVIHVRDGDTVKNITQKFDAFCLVSDKQLLRDVDPKYVTKLEGDLGYNWKVSLSAYKPTTEAMIRTYNERSKKKKLPKAEKFYQIKEGVLRFNPVDQYFISTGNTLFKGMQYPDLRRLGIDIETTNLDRNAGKIFGIAVRHPSGEETFLQGHDEKKVLIELNEIIRRENPDVIENHNIFGFDIPFIVERCRVNKVSMPWGRDGSAPQSFRDKLKIGGETRDVVRWKIFGRTIVDTMFSAMRYDVATRKLGGEYGLKNVAKCLNVARDEGAYLEGSEIYNTWLVDPDRVEKYALFDVREVNAISNIFHPDKFVLAQMAPISYEHLLTGGTSKIVENMMVRSYLRANHSLPLAEEKIGKFQGADVRLHKFGFFKRVAKADVSSMYPGIMRSFKIGPRFDPLGIFDVILNSLTDMRLKLKAEAKTDPMAHASQAAMKIVINTLYGYIGNARSIFNNIEGAAKVTEHGRKILSQIERTTVASGGQPIESDTDGVLYVLPDGISQNEMIEKINAALLAEFPGIRVENDSEELWNAFVYKKKNYAILEAGKVKITGGALKSNALPPLMKQFLADSFKALLTGDNAAFCDIVRSTKHKLLSGEFDISELAQKRTLQKSVQKYLAGKKHSQAEYEVLVSKGRLDVEAGTVVSIFKAPRGYLLADDYEGTIDIDHYLKQFQRKLDIFKIAFSIEDWAGITSGALENIPEAVGVSLPAEVKTFFVNVAANVKKTDGSSVERAKFIDINDREALVSFVMAKRGTDVYWSPYAYYSEKKPNRAKKNQLSYCPMLGDFHMEAEGDFDDKEKFSNAARLSVELRAVIHRDFQIPLEDIFIYFNGGKSFYIRIPHIYFVEGPVLRLDSKYLALAKHIQTLVADELGKQIDFNIYQITQILRIPGTLYPGGGRMVEIPLEWLEEAGWEKRKTELLESVDGYELNFFAPRRTDASTTYSQTLFQTITKEKTRHQTYRASVGSQKANNERIEEILKLDPSKFAPCVRNMAAAIAKGDSIGWDGRTKFIFEAARAGLTEEQICLIFLVNGDPDRYGVLDPNPSATFEQCGYVISEKYKASLSSDSGCDQPGLTNFCVLNKCYREEMRPMEIDLQAEGPTFEEFQSAGGDFTREFFSKDSNTPQFARAPLAAGKTYNAVEKAVRNLSNGLSTLILVPAHALGAEVLDAAKKRECSDGVVIPLRGKSDATCMEAHQKRQCKDCPIFKKLFEETELNESIEAISDGVLFLRDLVVLAAKFGVCATMLSRKIAMSKRPKVIVAPYAYLSNSAAMDILERCHFDEIIGDEADNFLDSLVSALERRIVLMKPRQKKAHLVRGECGGHCHSCVPHIAESSEYGISPEGGRVDSFNGISNKRNFIDLVESSVVSIEQAVKSGIVHDLYEYNGIVTVVKSICDVLPEHEKDEPPNKFLSRIKGDSAIALGEDEGSQISIPIRVPEIRKSGGTVEFPDTDAPDINMRITHMIKNILVEERATPADKERLKDDLKTVLTLVDFLQNASGHVYLVPEERIDKDSGYEQCRITLRRLDTDHYRRVLAFIQKKTWMISGTINSRKMIAIHLLTSEENISFVDAGILLHRSALLLIHNPNSKAEPAADDFPPWALLDLYLAVQEKINDVKILHFATNKDESRGFFEFLKDSAHFVSKFAPELRTKDGLSHDVSSSLEKPTMREALLCVDTLRSSTSRGVNRDIFSLCTVFGNGFANWDSRITLLLEAKKLYPHLTLDDLIQDEQKRAVIQALMRAPRSGSKTVCFYKGNLHPAAFPSFMRHRIVTTSEILASHLEKQSLDSVDGINAQIPILADAIAKFILGKELNIYASRDPVKDPLREAWLGRKDGFDNKKERIDQCIAEKGFVDLVGDKVGERGTWICAVEYFIQQGYLKPEKRKRKTVYVKGERSVSG